MYKHFRFQDINLLDNLVQYYRTCGPLIKDGAPLGYRLLGPLTTDTCLASAQTTPFSCRQLLKQEMTFSAATFHTSCCCGGRKVWILVNVLRPFRQETSSQQSPFRLHESCSSFGGESWNGKPSMCGGTSAEDAQCQPVGAHSTTGPELVHQ